MGYFRKNDSGSWQYITDDGFAYNFVHTSKSYDYGENQNKQPYYIKYGKTGWDEGTKAFDVFPIDDDLYKDNKGNVYPVEWGKYYDPKTQWLPELQVIPRTGTLILDTYYPLSRQYPYTGHSSLTIEPDNEWSNDYRTISKDSSDNDYNLITNNCADATREALEHLFNKKMNPYFFTTPGDSRDFLLQNGGTKMKDGSVRYKLTEEQLLKLKTFIDQYQKQQDI